MRKPTNVGRNDRAWLPLVVLRPHGPTRKPFVGLEDMIVAAIAEGEGMPAPGNDVLPNPDVFVAEDEAGRKSVRARANAVGDPAERDVVLAALEKAGRDPARHVVIATGSGTDVGIVVLGRSVEYVAGPEGLPVAIRFVTEILAVQRPEAEDLASGIATSAMAQIVCGIATLCMRAVSIINEIEETRASFGSQFDLSAPFEMPIEVHLRTTPGTDASFAEVMSSVLASAGELTRLGALDEFRALRVTGPYLPGTLFAETSDAMFGDTAERLRSREILRRANLVRGSYVESCEPLHLMLKSGRTISGRVFHVTHPDADAIETAELLIDPAGPRCADALRHDDAGPRIGLVQVRSENRRDVVAVVEIERSLAALHLGEGRYGVRLSVSMPGAVGAHRDRGVATALAETVLIQVRSDLETLTADLANHVHEIGVEVTVPAGIAAGMRGEMDEFVESLRDLPEACTVRPVQILVQDPRVPGPRPDASPMPRLPTPIEIDPDEIEMDLHDALAGLHEGQGFDHVEVLVRRKGAPAWIDIDLLPGTTTEAFLLLRVWVDDEPICALASTLSGMIFRGDARTLADTLDRIAAGPAEKVRRPDGAAKVRVLAERLFDRTSIAVAHMPYLFPDDESRQAYRTRREDGDEIAAHLAIVGEGEDYEGMRVYDHQHSHAPGRRFHVGVNDDLHTAFGPHGEAAVVAGFLVGEVENLLDGEEAVTDPVVVFMYAYAYVRRCCPDAVSESEYEAAARTIFGEVLDPEETENDERWRKFGEETALHVAAECGDAVRAPVYMAAARIAAAFQNGVDAWDGIGMLMD